MRLYKVTLTKTLTIVVEAESQEDARGISEDQGEDILGDDDRFHASDPIELTSKDSLPSAWSGSCLPYRCRSRHDDPEETIGELRGY